MKNTFKKCYPFLHLYIGYHGRVELGPDEYADSWVRLLDEGGTRLDCDQGEGFQWSIKRLYNSSKILSSKK